MKVSTLADHTAHYSTTKGMPYPEEYVQTERKVAIDGHDAMVYIEVLTAEGYTLAAMTTTDALALGVSLIEDAKLANDERIANYRRWYGDR
jgi:hypothetical protein